MTGFEPRSCGMETTALSTKPHPLPITCRVLVGQPELCLTKVLTQPTENWYSPDIEYPIDLLANSVQNLPNIKTRLSCT